MERSSATINSLSLIRVSKNNPCLICGKPDWCQVSADGQFAICARVQSKKQVGNSGWYHKLDGSQPVINPEPKAIQSCLKASSENISTTYRALLGALSLSAEHLRQLLSRGLTQEQIKNLEYKTLPLNGRRSIIQQLKGLNLDGVPGFWKDDFSWNHDSDKYQLAGQPGILIPILNLNKLILGFQIRCDDDSSGKYKWLSSADKPNGCSSGISVHISQPDQADQSEVWLTEGPLKADIARLRLNMSVIAIPGVACWDKAIPIIKQIHPQSVVVAFDMDKLTNQAVSTYKNLLIKRLLRMDLKVFEAGWNPKFKGLDDVLVTGDIK